MVWRGSYVFLFNASTGAWGCLRLPEVALAFPIVPLQKPFNVFTSTGLDAVEQIFGIWGPRFLKAAWQWGLRDISRPRSAWVSKHKICRTMWEIRKHQSAFSSEWEEDQTCFVNYQDLVCSDTFESAKKMEVDRVFWFEKVQIAILCWPSTDNQSQPVRAASQWNLHRLRSKATWLKWSTKAAA